MTSIRAEQQAAPSSISTTRTRLWHPQAHMPSVKNGELVLVRGEGAFVWDEQGRKFLDVPASLWYCNVGHGRGEIADAVARQMRQLETYSTFQQNTNRPALELAERISDLAPVEDSRIFFTSGGGDSIDTAVKLARLYWHAVGRPEKRTIVSRDRGYHGLHGFGTSITGIAVNREGLGELMPETVRVPTNDADAFVRLLEEQGDTIAAFVCEPVIGTGGVVFPSAGYLETVQQACRRHDVLFVVDEVITGFGRTGEMFASSRFGLDPDVLVVAKGLTSGYMPLGAAIVAQRVWDPFWKDGSNLVFRHGVTYAGHAAACAAAQANLDLLERERLVERVLELEPVLNRALDPLRTHAGVAEVRTGAGLLAGIELSDPSAAVRVCDLCLAAGALMRVIAGGTLQISPPFVVEEDDLDFVARVVADALDAAEA
jgi:putrescine---pyruvate transaminase